MSKKVFLIIGLGQLGRNLVATLYNANIDLFVVERDQEKLEEVYSMATQAICADASKLEVLKQIEVKAFDGAIVTLEHEIEASVKIIMYLKEAGMPFIMAKATNDFESRIFMKVGADKIICPDKEVGIRLGKEIAFGNYFDALELSQNYSISDIFVPADWVNKSIVDLDVRQKFGLNIIGIRRDEDLIVNPKHQEVLREGDILVILGENGDIQKLRDGKI